MEAECTSEISAACRGPIVESIWTRNHRDSLNSDIISVLSSLCDQMAHNYSSVGMVAFLHAWERRIRVQFRARARYFFLQSIWTGWDAHPASCPGGTVGSFLGGRVFRCWICPIVSLQCPGCKCVSHVFMAWYLIRCLYFSQCGLFVNGFFRHVIPFKGKLEGSFWTFG
jgi:hypothetical protein